MSLYNEIYDKFKKSLIVMYIIIYNCVTIDITIYQKYISNLKYYTIDNKKLPNQNIHHNYLIELFLTIFNLIYKRAEQTIAT
jgi:hypothetical protein